MLLRLQRRPHLLGAVGLFLLLAAVYSFSAGLRATTGAAITGDEPFYLLTTQSLLDDGDFDLRNQYERHSYASFFDHPEPLWLQMVPLPDGRLISPHDPGLALLVAPGFALDGLRGVQVQLLLLAALTLALTYVLVARETGRPLISWLAAAGVGLSATAFVYATEVYPEFPAALCLVVALLLVRGGSGEAAGGLALAVVLSGLAWLGIKYVPLGGIVALWFLWGATPRGRAAFVGLASVAGLFYVWAHYALFGDLTPYSVNTVYEGAPALDVLQRHVGFEDRVYRLWGLFIDRRFGLGRWAPLLLVVLPALPLLLSRGRLGLTVLALILAQLLIASFVAITMMGWWFPGRTLLTVLPLFSLPVAALADSLPRRWRYVIAGLGAYSLAITAALWLAARDREVRLAVDPFDLQAELFQAPSGLFPSYVAWGADTVLLTLAWLALLGAIAAVVIWRQHGPTLRRVASRLRRGGATVARGYGTEKT